jgi:hypothetical protein
VRIDCQRVGLFIKRLSLRVDSVDSNANLHQDALAPTPGRCIGRTAKRLGHGDFSSL